MSFFPPSIGTILKLCGGLIASALIYVFLLPLPLSLLGYYPYGVGWDVAQKIVDAKGEASDCRKIIHLVSQPFSPTEGEQRASCIYTYAKLTKDPSACELLMPSSYGLSCVGGAQSEPDLCSMSSGEVRWKDGSETYASCADPTKKRTKDGDACCLIARIAFVKSENDCSSLESYSEMHDQCLQSLAFKNHNPAVCEGIGNENTKSACTVNAQAIRKNPSICDGCKARVNTLDQLQ